MNTHKLTPNANNRSNFFNSEVFEMGGFYEETTAILEAKKASLKAKTQDEDEQMEDTDVIKMAVRFDK